MSTELGNEMNFYLLMLYGLYIKSQTDKYIKVKTIREVRVLSSREGRSVGGRHLLKTFQNVRMQVIQRADGSGSDTRGKLAAQRPAGRKGFLH